MYNHPMNYYPIATYVQSKYDYRLPNYQVLQTVQNCEAVCEYTKNEILKSGHSRTKQITLLSDCAHICGLTAKFVASDSQFSKRLANLCGQICEVCGNHCLNQPDELSRACGQICLNCARECREYATA